MALAPTLAYWVSTPSASRPCSMTSSSLLHCAADSANPAASMTSRSISTSPKSESAIRIVPLVSPLCFPLDRRCLFISTSVGVPRDSLGVREVLVFHGELHAAAGVELPNGRAVDFLPRRLVLEHQRGERASAVRDLLVGEQDVGAPFPEVDADPVPRPQDGEVASGSGLGTRVQNRRGVGGAALAPITDRRQRG